MDARTEIDGGCIHDNIDREQGYQLLRAAIEEIERRKALTLDGVRLFDHPALHGKYNYLNELSQRIVSHKFWLLRKSSLPGLLAIDFTRFDTKSGDFRCVSIRLADTLNGWRFLRIGEEPKDVPLIVSIEGEISEEKWSSLRKYLNKHKFYSYTMLPPGGLVFNHNKKPSAPEYTTISF